MAVVVEHTYLMRDGFGQPMDWGQDIIGLNVRDVNIQVEVSGQDLPAAIAVTVTSRAPNQTGGLSTIPKALTWKVKKHGPAPGTSGHTLYRLSEPVIRAGDFLAAQTGTPLEVATIVRQGGTSDAVFRQALGWANRGIGIQPPDPNAEGSPQGEVPHSLRLFQAGGVEVLEVQVVRQPGWTVRDGRSARLIRSPADLLYYSGHGLSANNCLGIETGGGYQCWATVGDILPYWKPPVDLDVMIIAGCSLLAIDYGILGTSGTGLEWAKLLRAKGGPLYALLGYAESAPLDAKGGDDIAREMAQSIAAGSKNWVKDWLSINGKYRAWNAVGMDGQGYWWLEPRTELGIPPRRKAFEAQDIKGPKAIP